jgi:DNA-binding transcriptional LysR family regulator
MIEWDVKKLRILRTLRDRGTVTATAEALRMTPSAVSQQLSNLSKQLGVPLLEAQGRRVRLTDAAYLVLRRAEAVFAELERADAELTGYLRGEAGQVRIAAFSTAVPALVVPAIQRLRAEDRPGPDVRVREAEAAQAYELLVAGDVDLALSLAAHAPTAHDPRFVVLPLLADPLDVALPADHHLAAAPALRLADLSGDPWIGPLVTDHDGRVRGRRIRTRAGAQRLRLDGDPGHGRGGHGGRADSAHGVGGTAQPGWRGDARPGSRPAATPCGGGGTAGGRAGSGGGPGPGGAHRNSGIVHFG